MARPVVVVKKVTFVAASSAANVHPDIGLELTQQVVADMTGLARHDLDLSAVPVATLLDPSGLELTVDQTVAGTAVPATDLNFDTATVADMTNLRRSDLAFDLTRLDIDYSRAAGATSVAETAVGARTDWTGDANATGDPDGSNATIAGSALGARGGQLEFGYANFAGKDDLAMASVALRFYVSQSGTIGSNGDLRLMWRKSSADAWTTLETITGNVNNIGAPRVHTVTQAFPNPRVLSDLDTIQTAVRFESATAQLYSAATDAVVLSVTAQLTEVL